jgi:hypothetical protein
MDNARLSVVRPPARHARIAVLAVVAVLGSGCVAPGPAPSLPAASSRVSPSAPGSTHPGASPAGSPSASPSAPALGPSPIVDLPPVDLTSSRFTILCESWGGERPPGAVECKETVPLALAALGPEQAALTRRLDVRYGDPCPADVTCPRRADVRTVIAISAAFDALLVRIARDPAGELFVWPPEIGPSMAPAAFHAPNARAPDFGPGTPRELRERPPLAFCGAERIRSPDDFDTAARRCFLAGVRAWVPVEMTSAETTETGPLVRVLRFTGDGGVRAYVRTADGWSAHSSAVSPIDTPAVFVLTAPTQPIELHP